MEKDMIADITVAIAMGMTGRSIHTHPLLVSCRRRTLRESIGTMVASVQITPTTVPKTLPKTPDNPDSMVIKMLARTMSRYTHQNSPLEARPLNTEYFLKNRLTASGKPMP